MVEAMPQRHYQQTLLLLLAHPVTG